MNETILFFVMSVVAYIIAEIIYIRKKRKTYDNEYELFVVINLGIAVGCLLSVGLLFGVYYLISNFDINWFSNVEVITLGGIVVFGLIKYGLYKQFMEKKK